MTWIVMPYVDPDLDGVACALAVQAIDNRWQAAIVGTSDDETRVVLESLNLMMPAAPPVWQDVNCIWLVDTHHPNQLPANLPSERVTRVTDHHPGGSPAAFPAARVQNEEVGAAATLIAEELLNRGTPCAAWTAQILQAAILSNTLNFAAPSTSERDRVAFARLSAVAALPDDLSTAMSAARRLRAAGKTNDVIQGDVKVFQTSVGRIAVSQLECDGAVDLLARRDLREALDSLSAANDACGAILNLVDTERVASALIASNLDLLNVLAWGIRAKPDSTGVIRVGRLLQRKTDVVPHLLAQ